MTRQGVLTASVFHGMNRAMATDDSRPGAVARRLLRATDRAALATHLAKRDDTIETWPYASLVLLACDHDAAPLVLMSDLSEHAKNIAADPRLSLLIDGTAGRVDPLTGPRVTILGTAQQTSDARLKARFVARHPTASLYADFGDFHLYRVTVIRAHFVAGFGRIHWIDAGDIGFDASSLGALAADEGAVVARLNGQSGLADMLGRLAGGRGASGWRVTGVDPEGIDLRRKGTIARAELQLTGPENIDHAIETLLREGDGKQRR